MNLTDARKILGLAPDEDPATHLDEFKNAREHIAAMVRAAPNDTLADRYQKGLIEFDQALAAVREHLEASGLMPPPLPESVLAQKKSAPEDEPPPLPETPEAGEISANPIVLPTPAGAMKTISEAAASEAATSAENDAAPKVTSIFRKLDPTPDEASAEGQEAPAPETPASPVATTAVPSEPPSTTAPLSFSPPEVTHLATGAAEITPAAQPPADEKTTELSSVAAAVPAPAPPPARVVADPPVSDRASAPTVVLKEIAGPRRPSTPIKTGPLQQPAFAGSGQEPSEEDVPAGRAISYFAWFLVFITAAMGGAWIYLQNEQHKDDQRLLRVAFLEGQGSKFVENRRWADAAKSYDEIDTLAPGSDIATVGRRSIEAGMAEEQTQFIGYWIGQATAELEAGRLEEATKAARMVLDQYKDEKESLAILDKIAAARAGQSRETQLAAARAAFDARKWDETITLARQILTAAPEEPAAKTLLADATAAIQKAVTDKKTAAGLLEQAAARDNGQFDKQALDWLREAASLDPENAEIKTRLEKLSSYTRTLRVPGDYATPAEALESARDRDRIVLGAATWKGPLVINAAVELQGAGFADTKIECSPEQGSAITIGPGAKGARITGISFRHETFAAGTDRFSVALVRGGEATFVDCRFTDASGHGLAVIEGGTVSVSRSRFADNGWDGVAAIGNGSRMEVRDCESLNNFEHGIESWDGAAVILSNNRCEGNSRNGIHADNGLASATIENNQLIANREFGLVVGSAVGGKISGNIARSNLLGGIVIRAAAGGIPVTANQATLNQGPGLVLERGLTVAAYSSNAATKNTGRQQILTDTDLHQEIPLVSESDSTPATATPAPAGDDAPVIPRATIIIEPPPLEEP